MLLELEVKKDVVLLYMLLMILTIECKVHEKHDFHINWK